MSEKNRHIVSEELLFRYFANEVSPDEQETVCAWKTQSAENNQEFERVQLLFLDLKALGSIGKAGKAYDVDSAWQKMDADKIGNTSKKNSIQWWSVAASVLVMLATSWYVFDSQQIEKVELVADVRQAVELVDGSVVSLNEGSSLIYPEKFKGNNRKVALQGEAYFEVTHNPEQPFQIQTDEVLVQVLGTTFNVNNSNSDSIVVTVDTGKVSMSVGGKEETLTAGYRGVYYRSTDLLVKIKSANTGVHNYWRTKSLSFSGATVGEAIQAIQQVYNVKIDLSDAAIANCRIHVDFENEQIEEVLEIISETLNLVWSNQGDAYLLAGYGCPK